MMVMGKRGPKPTLSNELNLLARLYYVDLHGLAYGRFLRRIDRHHVEQRVRAANVTKLNFGVRAKIEEEVDQSIADGIVAESDRERIIEDHKYIALFHKEREISETAGEEAEIWIKEPGRPEVLRALLNASTVAEIRKLCEGAYKMTRGEVRAGVYKDLKVEAWPIEFGSVFPEYLSKYAEQFIAARHEPRFPRSDRPSSGKKRLWFLACALAGAVLGIETRTAVNLLVGVKRPTMRRKKRPSQRDLEAQALAQIDIIKSYF